MKRARRPRAKNDQMRGEYDFSRGIRGKYAERYGSGSNVVILEPDVARLFPTSREVNEALRSLASKRPRRATR